jgi:gas vesicle protein
MAERNGATFLEVALSFVVGAIVGAAVALLYAPASGRETRQYLREKAESLRDKAELALEQTKSRIRRARRAVAEEAPVAAESATDVEG